jgi:hypothetical protein
MQPGREQQVSDIIDASMKIRSGVKLQVFIFIEAELVPGRFCQAPATTLPPFGGA